MKNDLLGHFRLAKPSRCLPLVGACIALSLIALSMCAQGNPDIPRNVELVNRAWDAYRSQNYDTAMTAADRCVDRFKEEADADEAALEARHAKLLPTGAVGPKVKDEIYAQGVLNDVATCFWIKGISAQLSKHDDAAREAYTATMKYRYARTWDPKGWFWSPAEDAADRLRDLR